MHWDQSQDQSFEDFKQSSIKERSAKYKSSNKNKKSIIGSQKQDSDTRKDCNQSITISPVNSKKKSNNHCIEQVNDQHSSKTETQNQKTTLCQKNLSYLIDKNQKENKESCLNKYEAKEKQNSSEFNKNKNQVKETILNCPLCSKHFQTQEARQTHLKLCSNKFKLKPRQLIDAVCLQEKHAKERLEVGLPVLPYKITKSTREHKKKCALKKPKNKTEEELQIALALSASLQENSDKIVSDEDQLSIDECFLSKNNVHKQDEHYKHVMKIEPLENKKLTKKRKITKVSGTPMLLLRTEEERTKLLEEKVSNLFTSELTNHNMILGKIFEKDKISDGTSNFSSNRLSRFIVKKCSLWNLTSQENTTTEQFYVLDLRNIISPCKIKAGSKLRRFSQIAGSSLADLKCLSVSSSISNESNKNEAISSTQELIDFVLEDEDEICCSQFKNESYTNCSLILEEQKEDTDFQNSFQRNENNPVIESALKLASSFKTLIDNPEHSDVSIILVNNKCISAHSLIFNIRCPKITEDFEFPDDVGKKFILNWADISYEAAFIFLEVIYSGNSDSTNITSDKINQIKKLIYRYQTQDIFEDLNFIVQSNLNQQKFDKIEQQQLKDMINNIWERNNEKKEYKNELNVTNDSTDSNDDLDDVYKYLSQKQSNK